MNTDRSPSSPPAFLNRLSEESQLIFFNAVLPAGQLVYLNPFFEQVFQLARADVMTNPTVLLSTIHPEDQDYIKRCYLKLTREELDREFRIEFRVQRADESYRWLRLLSFAYVNQGPDRTVSGVLQDITDEKEHAMVLNKFASKKNAILEILSHDLSRPLANIQGLSSLISNRLQGHADAELHRFVDKITDVSKQAIQLIRDFVQQEFLESVQVNLVKKKINIVQELGLLMDEYQYSGENIGKTFEFLPASPAIDMLIDDVKFMQVMNNLISNAIKFTPDKGVITVRVEDQDEKVLVTVKDNGIGIPAHLQQGLFEKFPKARRPGLKGEPSTGLGMSIIKLIVDWHEGTIRFESEENQGTTFFIELPKE